MGLASFVVGILAILLSWIPCLWPIVVVHIVVGLALGIRGLGVTGTPSDEIYEGKNGPEKARPSMAVAGIWLNCIAALLIITWRLFWETDGFGAF